MSHGKLVEFTDLSERKQMAAAGVIVMAAYLSLEARERGQQLKDLAVVSDFDGPTAGLSIVERARLLKGLEVSDRDRASLETIDPTKILMLIAVGDEAVPVPVDPDAVAAACMPALSKVFGISG